MSIGVRLFLAAVFDHWVHRSSGVLFESCNEVSRDAVVKLVSCLLLSSLLPCTYLKRPKSRRSWDSGAEGVDTSPLASNAGREEVREGRGPGRGDLS